MLLSDTVKIIKIIVSAYPRHFAKMSKPELEDMIQHWNLLFTDFEYPDVEQGLISFIKTDTSGFPPAVGQIIAMIPNIRNHESVTTGPIEAWGLVSIAIRNSNYHADEEFEKLPPLVQKAVGSPATLREWAAMESGVVHSVEQSNFLRTYEALIKRTKDDVKLPKELRLALEGYKVPQIEDKEQEQEKTERASAEQIDELISNLKGKFKEVKQ